MARIEAKGYSLRFVELTPGHETREKAEVVRLCRSASLRCRVTGSPEPELTVCVEAETDNVCERVGGYFLADLKWETSDTIGGEYVLSDLPAESLLTVRILRRGHELYQERLVLEPGDERLADLQGERLLHLIRGPLASLRGRVVDQDGHAVSSATLWLVPSTSTKPCYLDYWESEAFATTVTDLQGEYELKGIPPGTWALGPAPQDPVSISIALRFGDSSQVLVPLAHPIDVRPGETEASKLLKVCRGLYIEGRVVDTEGRPVHSRVNAYSTAFSGVVSTESSNRSGYYRLGPLPSGKVKVRAHQAGGWLRYSNAASVSAGDQGVDLVLAQANCALAGEIVDHDTGDVCNGEIRILRAADRALRIVWTTYASFALSELDAGEYTLVAQADNGKTGVHGPVKLRAGDEMSDLKVTVKEGGRLRIKLKGSGDRRWVFVYWSNTLIDRYPQWPGTSESMRVPVGRISIGVCDDSHDHAEMKDVTVVEGEECLVTLGNADGR
ncbi:MAG: carboxypeptidase-like regulatory domain-containing protein [Planctomycetota bacterium]